MDFELMKQVWNEDRRLQVWVLGCFMLLLNVAVYMSIPDCRDCTLTLGTGEKITGSCADLKKLTKQPCLVTPEDAGLDGSIYTLLEKDARKFNETHGTLPPIMIPDQECPECPICLDNCPTHLPCPECPPVKECGACVCNCPICTQTACPEIVPWNEDEEFLSVKDTLYNLRPRTESPATQHGWFKYRCEVQKAFGDKCAMYNEASSIYDRKSIYGESEAEDIMDGMYCFNRYYDNRGPYFNLSQSPDQNGRKRWSWRCDSGSDLQVRHL